MNVGAALGDDRARLRTEHDAEFDRHFGRGQRAEASEHRINCRPELIQCLFDGLAGLGDDLTRASCSKIQATGQLLCLCLDYQPPSALHRKFH